MFTTLLALAIGINPAAIDVNPSIANPAGGEAITITFTGGLTNACAGPLTCVPSVRFDDVPGVLIESRADRLIVRTPPHARGETKLSIFIGQTYEKAFHYVAEEDFERVLLPVNVPTEVPGAFGSRWQTTAWIANIGPEAIDVRWPACFGVGISPCPQYHHLPPDGRPAPVTPDRANSTPGAFLYVPKFALGQVFADARVQDLSRDADSEGTELPLVRVDDFLTDLLLLDVRYQPPYRALLRVYGRSHTPQRVRMRVWSRDAAGDPLLDVTRDLNGYVSVVAVQFPLEPAYTELSLDSLPPGQAGVPKLRIEVSAVDGQPLWACASITNNTTQQVTIVTPQPADHRGVSIP
jgi:hypothetical protein